MITPASIRNNNPSAQYPGRAARKFGATTFEVLRSKDGVHKIATFPSSVHGAAAQFELLMNGRSLGRLLYRGKTLKSAIETWCGGYYADTYLKVLEEKAGVKGGDVLSADLIGDPARAIPLAKAMAWQEAGRDYPLSDEEWQAAHRMAFGGAVAPAWTPFNDVPSPGLEQRRAEAMKQWAPTVTLGLTGGTVAAPAIPAVPQVLNDTLLNLSSWQAFGTTASALMTKQMLPPLFVAALVYWVVMKLIPWWRT